MKKILWIMISMIAIFGISLGWNEASLEIIPEAEQASNAATTVEEISQWWKVWEIYRQKANSDLSLWEQFATWVMTRDTILDYAAYIMKFLWQLALLAWAVMLVYFGYQKALSKGTNSALLHLIIWILVVIFSYVIIRTIRYMFIA